MQKLAGYRDVLFDVHSSYVIDLSNLTMLKNCMDAATVILDMQPAALLFSITINRKGLVIECVSNYQRQKFLWELKRPVIVGRARDHGRELVGTHIGEG